MAYLSDYYELLEKFQFFKWRLGSRHEIWFSEERPKVAIRLDYQGRWELMDMGGWRLEKGFSSVTLERELKGYQKEFKE